jgi:ABC-type Fe3+-siderophore transport system permease subunit
MAYELIPYPISIIFLGVFWFAVMLVLWKLRTKGKIYFILYLVGMAITILLGVIVGYLLVASMFGW